MGKPGNRKERKRCQASPERPGRCPVLSSPRCSRKDSGPGSPASGGKVTLGLGGSAGSDAQRDSCSRNQSSVTGNTLHLSSPQPDGHIRQLSVTDTPAETTDGPRGPASGPVRSCPSQHILHETDHQVPPPPGPAPTSRQQRGSGLCLGPRRGQGESTRL